MSIDDQIDEIRKGLIEVPTDKIIRFHIKPGSLVFLRWREGFTLDTGPLMPVGIVSTMKEIPEEVTPLESPHNEKIKVKREDYFMTMQPPYEIAGYIDGVSEGSYSVRIISHSLFDHHSSYPFIRLSAIESFDVVE